MSTNHLHLASPNALPASVLLANLLWIMNMLFTTLSDKRFLETTDQPLKYKNCGDEHTENYHEFLAFSEQMVLLKKTMTTQPYSITHFTSEKL